MKGSKNAKRKSYENGDNKKLQNSQLSLCSRVAWLQAFFKKFVHKFSIKFIAHLLHIAVQFSLISCS